MINLSKFIITEQILGSKYQVCEVWCLLGSELAGIVFAKAGFVVGLVLAVGLGMGLSRAGIAVGLGCGVMSRESLERCHKDMKNPRVVFMLG